MLVAELEACHVLDNATFPAPVRGCMVSFVVFYERGFDMPLHQFLRSPLWYYNLKLHHLTPSGVLHIAAFVTLCVAYLGINSELDLWKYLFHIWCPQNLETELTI
jgi:hypothetical protein